MLKYRNRYRVCYEIDKKGKICDFTFIPCSVSKGSNICRYDDFTLSVYITSIKTFNRIALNKELFTIFQEGQSEGTLLFSEENFKQANKFLKARKKGRTIPPRNASNKFFQN